VARIALAYIFPAFGEVKKRPSIVVEVWEKYDNGCVGEGRLGPPSPGHAY